MLLLGIKVAGEVDCGFSQISMQLNQVDTSVGNIKPTQLSDNI